MITIQAYYKGVELELFKVFTSAISETCSRDYTPEQIRAWLPLEYNAEKWRDRVEGINPYIAIYEGKIAGYADLQSDGYIDHFVVGAEYQSKGVGGALMEALIGSSDLNRAYSHVSITARPFFEKYGFVVVGENTVSMRGVELKNYIMERLAV
ncbi:GNAT family N-acetyltransferase [Shewanella algidipiscicola]|uniref:Acetyltransferase n=1 Tax=Shewanella algidipiscicola TaxID=614070 RepID=A0ABQ4NSK3_9GAMM|nr:GNAT family N-acetyltransferase [Shewanella algidipiscicola]GIU02171.1 acetyltransferase [Shewanella algidipiscicola]